VPASTGLLISGGLDSAILLGDLLAREVHVQPIYVRCGLRWEVQEQTYLRRFLDAIAQPRLDALVTFECPMADVYGEHWSLSGYVPDATTPDEAVYLPGRNLLLLLKAAVWCQIRGIPELALAPLGSNPFPDASQRFFDHLLVALNCTSNSTIRLNRPFAKMHKQEVMRLGCRLPLQWTFSCIDPQSDLHCGRCNKCWERQSAFRDAGMVDPTEYASIVESN